MRNSRPFIIQRLLHLGPKPGIVLALFLTVLNELPHKFADQLRSRLMEGSCLSDKCVAQFGLQLDGENSLFGHWRLRNDNDYTTSSR